MLGPLYDYNSDYPGTIYKVYYFVNVTEALFSFLLWLSWLSPFYIQNILKRYRPQADILLID